jgi:glucose-6-phosphate 1-dehydrogenase
MNGRAVKAPFIMTIFGGTGDLAKRKLLPALVALYRQNYLPKEFYVVAIGRRFRNKEEYLEAIEHFLGSEDREIRQEFCKHIRYFQLDIDNHQQMVELRYFLHDLEEEMHECLSKLYYMAVGPEVLGSIVQQLGRVGLHIGCGEDGKWSRIIVEKPFGEDLPSSRSLNSNILEFFAEQQIYRIDHYLGKELIQNIISIRFANALFFHLWSGEHIDHIQIIADEGLGMEGRGRFYDQVGALRDFVQSHILQLIALAVMDEPKSIESEAIRDAKAVALKSLRAYDQDSICGDILHGQYESYRQEDGVENNSLTETFVAFKTFVDLPKWRGVPIYVRTGKKLGKKSTAIHFYFKKHCSNLFCNEENDQVTPNVLSILLAPKEGIYLRTMMKRVGFENVLRETHLEYTYKDTSGGLPEAYERLLLDAMNGDQSLFLRTDEIEESWRFVDKILELWGSHKPELYFYKDGSGGPIEAEELIQKDGRSWLRF